MGGFEVLLSKDAINSLNLFDPSIKALLLSWINKHLQNCYNPRALGHQISKYNYNSWKYEIGIYRLITHISPDSIYILQINKN